jgi:hypothetical protein
MSGKSRIEKILENLLGENNVIEPPIGRDEKILYSILNDLEYTEPPHSIFEDFLLAIKNGSTTEAEYPYIYLTRDEKILFCKLNRLEYFEPPHSRLERLLIKWLYLDLYLNIDGVPPFTFTSNGSPIIDYTIYANTVQSGTPTHDSPVMPQGCGERTGNLVDAANLSNVKWATRYPLLLAAINSLPNGVYTMSISFELTSRNDTTDSSRCGWRITKDSSELSSTSQNWNRASIGTVKTVSGTFTINDNNRGSLNALYLYGCGINAYGATGSANATKIMLNTGSTALPYESYGYKIPISSASTTTPIYLGEVETTRRVKKLVLTGEENEWSDTYWSGAYVLYGLPDADRPTPISNIGICSHFVQQNGNALRSGCFNIQYTAYNNHIAIGFGKSGIPTLTAFKSYLAAQYAAGTPVTVWYALATPETEVVNEPLMKIGDYADSISYEQTVVSIPTVSGRNTFDVLGNVKPSNVELTYAPRAPLLGKRKTVLKK